MGGTEECAGLPAGPELDVLVGETVFGIDRSARKYSTDFDEAMEVMRSKSWYPGWAVRASGLFPGQWEVIEPLSPAVYENNTSPDFRRIAVGRSAAHAVCRAVLAPRTPPDELAGRETELKGG